MLCHIKSTKNMVLGVTVSTEQVTVMYLKELAKYLIVIITSKKLLRATLVMVPQLQQ